MNSEKKDKSSQQLARRLLLCSFNSIIKEFLVVSPFPINFNCLWPSIFVNIVVLLFTRTIKVIYYGYLFHIVFH